MRRRFLSYAVFDLGRMILRAKNEERSRNCCEYCRLPAVFDVARFPIGHVYAQQHHGPTNFENLAWACFPCNNHKGPNIASIDPDTGELTPLLNPRRDDWQEHMQRNGPLLIGSTPVGRATIRLSEINTPERIVLRRELIEEGVFPL